MQVKASVPLALNSALVVYGSETGNSLDIAEQIQDRLRRIHFKVHLSQLNNVNLNSLLKYSFIVFAISTTGQGMFPKNAQSFWKRMLSTRLRPGCLQWLRFTSFGLGDSSYTKFNWAHRKLYNRLCQLGAIPFHDRGEADDQHPEGIDGSFIPWIENFLKRIIEIYPLPDNITPIPKDQLLRPNLLLELYPLEIDNTSSPEFNNCNVEGNVNIASRTNVTPMLKNGINVTVVSNVRVTPETHWQDVRHLTLRSSERHTYEPGDVISILSQNITNDVERLIQRMDWTSIADRSLKIVDYSSETGQYVDDCLGPIYLMKPLTPRGLLKYYLDIKSIPRRSFFELIWHFATDKLQRERLEELSNPAQLDEMLDYTSRPRRSILEVLEDFDSVKLPFEWMLSVFPAIQLREFSIASGGKQKYGDMGSTNFEILIAIVKYRTILKLPRWGFCTRYISKMKENDKLSIILTTNRFNLSPSQINKSAIMVGPGTGVAFLRSLVQEKVTLRENDYAAAVAAPDVDAAAAADENLKGAYRGTVNALFYGCRNKHADYFFQSEWELFQRQINLNIFVAFSRDQTDKIYVQDLILQQSGLVYEIIQEKRGMVFVSGSLKSGMPTAVRSSIVESIEKHGNLSKDKVNEYMQKLEKDGRYIEDTW